MTDKALIIAPNGGWDMVSGGGAYVTLKMAETLSKRGYSVLIASLQARDIKELENIYNLKLTSVKIQSLYYSKNGELKHIPYQIGYRLIENMLKRLIREFKPDILVSNDDILNKIANQIKKLHIKSYLYVHFSTIIWSHYPKLAQKILKRNPLMLRSFLNYARKKFAPLNKFDIVIPNSSVTESFIKQVYPECETEIIHPPINEIKNKKSEPKKRLIIHSAQQDKSFLGEELIETAKKMNSVKSGYHFIVTGATEPFKKKVTRYQLKNLHTYEFLPRKIYEDKLRESTIYSHFKWFETFGIATAEAMNVGSIPVTYISPYNATWSDIIQHGKHGIGFTNPTEFIEITEKINKDTELRARMSQKAQKRAAHFTAQFQNRLENIL